MNSEDGKNDGDQEIDHIYNPGARAFFTEESGLSALWPFILKIFCKIVC